MKAPFIHRCAAFCRATAYTPHHSNLMARLEDLRPPVAIRSILPDALATVVSVEWHGSEIVGLIFKSLAGKLHETLDEVLAGQDDDFDANNHWALAWFEQLAQFVRWRVIL